MLPPKAFMLNSLMEDRVANEVRNTEKEKDTVYRPPLFLEMNVNSINILRHKKE